jgi:toxin ParE1/3/4
MSSYRIVHAARADLQGIHDYIFTRNPAAASDLMLRFYDIIEMLARHPMAGARQKAARADVRKFPCDNYMVFYRPIIDGIVVLRVLDGRRDIAKIKLT